ncbi:aminotransferase class I/II-fold pyridoxal phosphate-dependent enzyme [Salibacterium halotolerans]|uniref:Cystathionine beta-lyase family protein involved in aluminum resistance n=1 Tax=Salibacterium halotolerans TaxID=1884432 RepID=A0A1I5UXT6_9BACI|nr:methionine gamma-lyase family protein [Salibacterium halotolerans]SFQ00065.1 Cystathionine beta-lyase family protein involved in aluminum resistance [Salibacterium halotolerans]
MYVTDKVNFVREQAEKTAAKGYQAVEKTAEANQRRLLQIFHKHKASSVHIQQASSGYGYDDVGRETLDNIYADVFGTEAAIVRPHFISGTHAITAALFGVLRPGDHLLYAGAPYDTLQTAVGLNNEEAGTMMEYGMECSIAPLDENGFPDPGMLLSCVEENTKVVALQRSKGYDDRPSLSITKLKDIISHLKAHRPDIIVFVDNCYGEFVEKEEPGHAGADITAGSLIKNPGGGIVRSGGYIAGNAKLVEQASSRFAAPGIGLEGGAMFNTLPEMYQGLFMAPHVVGQALKGALFTSALFEQAGLKTFPSSSGARTDIVQAVEFEEKQRMVRFCQAVQEASPVDAMVQPHPSSMPGYADDVIMAAGTFIQGSSIELTADGPLRPPYRAYVQGGLTTAHVIYAVTHGLETLLRENLLFVPAESGM